MTRSLRLLLLVVLASAATQAFGQSRVGDPVPPPKPLAANQTKPLDLGHLKGTIYVNDFFGLSLSVPRDWLVVSGQQRAEIVEEGKKLIVAEDETKQAEINASIERSTVLLSLTKLPAGQPANASLMVIAERIPSTSIISGADVLRLMEASLLKGTNFNVEFQGGVRTEQLGGSDFGVVTLKINSPVGVYMQKIYVTTKNGFALQFFFTYLDAADLPAFDSLIKSIRIR